MENRNFTAEELEQLTAKHGKIKQFEVDERIVCFRQPTRLEVAAANKVLVKTQDPGKYADTIINTCLLNYKEEVGSNDELYLALTSVTDQVVTGLKATLKNG